LSTNPSTVRAIIKGRVQGVGFRAFVEREARVRNLKGWVRNRRDGSVEAAFSGPPDIVEDMLSACRRGPSYSRVDHVSAEPATEATLRTGSADRFGVLPTV
jgi:acylphosphatase